ncbi:MAG: histidine phosphatase family protein [Deltaproteobacteria bacterium]|nr:histidine phosphatase family protein [Deltaproteobacteria bacterium]
MARIYLVRHGEAAARWADELDPGLSELGRTQAREAEEALAPLGPLDIVSSPLMRARETAEPLVNSWGVKPRIERRLTEIPTPEEVMDTRMAWLEQTVKKRWADLDGDLAAWRRGVIDAVLALERDTVVFSHFVAINAALGAAVDDDRVMHFWPNNASISIVETDGSTLALIERGGEAVTDVR